MTRGVDVAGRGRAVSIGCRGVGDDWGLARVAGADPDYSWMCHTHIRLLKNTQLVWETSRKHSVSMFSLKKQHQAAPEEQRRHTERERGITLSVRGVSVVEGLLALTDGGSERHVGLHHPLLTAVHHGLCGHDQRVALRYIFCQGGQRLLRLGSTREAETEHDLEGKHTHLFCNWFQMNFYAFGLCWVYLSLYIRYASCKTLEMCHINEHVLYINSCMHECEHLHTFTEQRPHYTTQCGSLPASCKTSGILCLLIVNKSHEKTNTNIQHLIFLCYSFPTD